MSPDPAMTAQQIYRQLPQRLLPWFSAHARQLPWRRDRQPYHVWLSEIMLQQTRVEAVKSYYLRFLQTCPDVQTLAETPDDVLNKLWEGLGYYSRVRNLKRAAIQICEQYGGEFPRRIEQLRALPGVGPYTAGAIASICFEQPEPAIDGNILRVLSRVTALAEPVDQPAVRKKLDQALRQVYPQGQCGAFTQSLMELGAIVCLPNGAPLCAQCPLSDLCRAAQTGTQTTYPVKSPKRPRRVEEKTVLLMHCGGRVAVERREPTGLLAGLWQYPNVDGTLTDRQAVEQAERWGVRPTDVLKKRRRTHIFTHVTWHMTAYDLACGATPEPFTWVTEQELDTQIALPTAFRMFREPLSGDGENE